MKRISNIVNIIRRLRQTQILGDLIRLKRLQPSQPRLHPPIFALWFF